MTEDTPRKIQAAYTVIINLDNTISTEALEANEFVERTATRFDVYQASRELVSDIESQLLADRVAATVLAKLSPKEDTPADKLRSALSDRGIETP